MAELAIQRDEMVEHHLVSRGTPDPAILEAMAEVPREDLLEPGLERAIGVIYRPRTEIPSHHFQACLPRQLDEYVRLDESRAVTPVGREAREATSETFPFGL